MSIPLTISYTSLRGEVWAHYWRLWRQKLWRFHAVLFATVTLGLLIGLSGWRLSPAALAGVAILGGLIPCALFALYPLAKFKPQTRLLTIDRAGLATSIGKLHGEVPWSGVDAIVGQQELIIIQRTNGNAFIIPARAFASSDSRAAFLSAARDAWSGTVRP